MPADATILHFGKAAQPAAASVLSVENLSVRSTNGDILKNVSFTLKADGITALMGPNGAGKSVLLRTLCGLLAPSRGKITIEDAFRTPAIVFQRPVLLRRSVRANLMHALKIAGVQRRARQGKLAELLVMADLARISEQPARTLSGGEQQRLAFARAICASPKLLLLDEPTAHLDPAATLAIDNLTRAAQDQGSKIVFVTHDKGQAQRLCNNVLFLSKGRLAEHSRAEQFFKSPTSPEGRAYLDGKILL